MTQQICVFLFQSYQDFIAAYIDEKIRQRGLSFRYFSKKAQVSSPNFFQQIIGRKRFLTIQSAVKIARAFDLQSNEKDYFVELVKLERAKSLAEQTACLESLTRLARLGLAITTDKQTFHSSWLHSVVWELASIRNFVCTPQNMHKRLGHVATLEELQTSLNYLVAEGLLKATDKPNQYRQENVNLSSKDDLQSLYIRHKHQKFLELAGNSLNLPIHEREFQGLTIAVGEHRLLEAKKRIREFMRSLSAELSNDNAASEVIRLQICCYPLTKKET